MRAGILVAGIMIFILSAMFFYIQKPIATPANPGAVPDAGGATLANYWSLGGMGIGALIMIVALLLPKVRIDRKQSPMKEYEKTNAGKDDGTQTDLL